MPKGRKEYMTKIQQTYYDQILKETETALSDMPKKIHTYVEDAVLSLIGISKSSWGGSHPEIDHCNGRNSVLIDAFRNLAQKEAERIAGSYKMSKEDVSLFETTFKNEFKNQFRYAVSNLAKEKANELARETLEKLKLDVNKIINEKIK